MTTRGYDDLRFLDTVLALLGGEAANVDRMLTAFDADRFSQWCLRHQLGGLTYLLLEDAVLRVSGARTLLGALRGAYLEQWARTDRLRLNLATLDTILRKSGRDYLVLKGLPFAQKYYGAYDRRATGDLDIWVRRADAHFVADSLERSGLVRCSPRYRDDSSTYDHVHHVEFTLDGTGVELHHALRVHPTFHMNDEAIWEERTRVDILGDRYATLSDEHALLLHLLGFHTDVQIGQVNARWFADLYQLLLVVEPTQDWEIFLAKRDGEGTRKICVNSLAAFLLLTRRDDCFPRLSSALANRGGDIVLAPDRLAYLELLRGASTLVRKTWPLKQYQSSLSSAAAWWLSGMPRRIAAKPDAFARDASGPPADSPWEGATAAAEGHALGAELGVNVAAQQQTRIQLGSLTVTVRYERVADLAAIEELFRLRPGSADGPSHRAASSEREHGVVHLVPRGSDELAHFRRPVRAIVDHQLEGIVEIREGIVHAWIADGPRFEAFLLIDRDRQTESLLLHSLMVVLNKILARHDRYHVHAAAVTFGDAATLFVGDKGSGKSTISLALGRAGATVFSEDHVFVRRADGRFLVSGCDRDMHLTTAAEQHFFDAPLEGRLVQRAGVTKKQIDMASVVDARPYVETEIESLFFPKVGGAFEIRPLEKSEASARILGPLTERHRFADRADAEQFLETISRLVESCTCWELTLSRDLSELAQLAQFLTDRQRSSASLRSASASTAEPTTTHDRG